MLGVFLFCILSLSFGSVPAVLPDGLGWVACGLVPGAGLWVVASAGGRFLLSPGPGPLPVLSLLMFSVVCLCPAGRGWFLERSCFWGLSWFLCDLFTLGTEREFACKLHYAHFVGNQCV